ncbi:MAG: hypothetical protein IJA24_05910 [Alistipes sp.]|nr:hypothetical protein [Alistipes sp.]
MAKKKIVPIELYKLTNVPIDSLIDKCIEITTRPMVKVVNADGVTSDSQSESPILETKVKAAPRRAILYQKFLFLVHLIISRCSASKDNRIQLHSERLKNVLGNDYDILLETLCEMNIISMTTEYAVGVHCRFISLKDWRVHIEPTINIKVAEYLSRWAELTQKDVNSYNESEHIELEVKIIDGRAQVIKKGEKIIGEQEQWLYDMYKDSLSYLDLKISKDNAIGYIDSLFTNRNTHKYHHCLHNILSFDKKNIKITSIDKQDRIYHYLTYLRKDLKYLFNLKFQLDIANSHPLLLCKLLIVKYKLDYNILNIIYNKERVEVCDLHNVSEQLCNELQDKGLSIEKDVVRFIYACSKGMMWDELNNSFPEYSRDEIKSNAFALIFYNPRNIARYTEFGKKFMSVYPNVYAAIEETKDKTRLPLLMMKTESTLMRRILTKCYLQGWKVISIHDAIVALDTQENEGLEPMAIKRIINDVYRAVLLHPTVHIDEFPLPAV